MRARPIIHLLKTGFGLICFWFCFTSNYINLLCFQVQGEDGIKLHIEKEHAVHIVNQSDSNITGNDLEQTLPLPHEIEISAVPTFKKIKRKWPQEKSHQCNLCPYETNRAERLRVHILGKLDRWYFRFYLMRCLLYL